MKAKWKKDWFKMVKKIDEIQKLTIQVNDYDLEKGSVLIEEALNGKIGDSLIEIESFLRTLKQEIN